MENIYHYRHSDYSSDPWKDVLITSPEQVSAFTSRTLLSINGQNVLREHASTYITGSNTALAHHFAKMLAASILTGSYAAAPSIDVKTKGNGRALWVDSVHSVYACADFYNEMRDRFDPDHKNFSLMCLDKLGQFRYDQYSVISQFEEAINFLKPTLVVIDDVDHLMPNCGINVASAFNHAIRDTINHTSTACLFIGYNHLGKRASTTGNLGSLLFPEADNVFSVSTQRTVSRVRLVRSRLQQSNAETEFLFTVGSNNMPHQVVKVMPGQCDTNFVEQNTLRDIIGDIIKPGETISPDQLFDKLNSRRQEQNRFNRTRTLIAQATQLGIIKKAAPDSNDYTLNIKSQPSPTQPPTSSPNPHRPPLPTTIHKRHRTPPPTRTHSPHCAVTPPRPPHILLTIH